MKSIFYYLLLLFIPGLTYGQQSSLDTTGCSPFVLQLSSPVSSYDSLIWDFGNGAYSNLENPNALYTDSGQYSVHLYVDYGTGSFDTLSNVYLVTVVSPPVANFTFNQSGNCQNEVVVDFQNQSQNFVSVEWDFGDGNQSNQNNPSHLYNSDGIFFPILTVYNDIGCFDQYTSDTIIVDPKPYFQEMSNINTYCGGVDSVELEIDGSFSNLFIEVNGDLFSDTIISFANEGLPSDSILVWGSNQYGCIDSVYFSNIFTGDTMSDFSFNLNNAGVCLNQQTLFTIFSSVNSLDSIHWFVNDVFQSDSSGFLFTPSLNQTYTIEAVIYYDTCSSVLDTVVIPFSGTVYSGSIVLDSVMCENEVFTIHLSSDDFDHLEWFVNSVPSSSSDSMIFTATNQVETSIQVAVYDTNQCMYFMTDTILVPELEADIFFFNPQGCASLTTTFMSIGLGADQHYWDFGDGTTGTGSPIQNTYANSGSYSPQLIVENNLSGCRDTLLASNQIEVYSDEIYFDTLVVHSCGSYELTINNFNIGNDFWIWDYGDGSTSNGQNAHHIYDTPGTYLVNLTSNSSSGCQKVINGIAVITVSPMEQPMVDFVINCPDVSISLIDASTSQINWSIEGLNQGSMDSLTFSAWNYFSQDLMISYSYLDSNGCMIDQDFNIPVSCPDSNNVNSPSFLDPNDPGASVQDTIVICIDEAVGFQFIQLPNQASLEAFMPSSGESFSTFPSLYYFPSSGYFQPVFVVNGVGGIDSIQLNRVYQVVEYQSSFNLVLNPLNCDSLSLTLVDSLNPSNIVSWNVDSYGNWNTNHQDLVIPNQNFNIHVDYEVLDSNGCGFSLDQTLSYSKLDFIADFSSEICFGDSAVYYTDIALANFPHVWDFGDGSSSNQGSGFHNYQMPGVYYPSLVLDDLFGCIDTISFDSISIWNPTNQILGMSDVACMRDTMNLTAQNQSLNCRWFLNDNLVSNDSVFNFYTPYSGNSNFYIVRLESEINGCISEVSDTTLSYYPQLTLTVDQDRKCYPMTVDYSVTTINTNQISWLENLNSSLNYQFSSDTSYNLNSANDHLFGVSIMDSLGCDIIVEFPPIQLWEQDYSISTDEGCSPLNVAFIPPSNAVQFLWDFGGGPNGIDTNATVIKTYLDPGEYHLSATFTMDDFCILNFLDSNIVNVHAIFAEPFLVQNDWCVPSIVEFGIDSLYSVDNLTWVYGDGSSSNLLNSNHTFVNAGVFYPELIVSNQFGCADTVSLSDSIFLGGGDPIINLSDTQACVSDSILFNLENASFYNQVNWFLGDGANFSDASFHHSFDLQGDYSILLNVEDTLGCTSSLLFDTDIEVFEMPSFDFLLNDSVYCLGDSLDVSINNPHTYAITWEVGGLPYQLGSPLTQSGDLMIRSFANSNAVCTFQLQDSILVYSPQNPEINGDSLFCMENSTYTFQVDIPGGIWTGQSILDSITGEINLENPIIDTLYYSLNDICESTSFYHIQIDSTVDAFFTTDSIYCQGLVNLNLNYSQFGGQWSLGAEVLDSSNLNALQGGTYELIHSIENGACYDEYSMTFTVIAIPDFGLELADSVYCLNQEIEISNATHSGFDLDFFAVNQNGDTLMSLNELSNTPGAYTLNYFAQDTNQCQSEFTIGNLIVLNADVPGQIQIIRSTVIADQMVYTEWEIDSADLIKIEDLQILRTINGENNWLQIDQIPKSWNFYEDYSAFVTEEDYEYQIRPNYKCSWDVLPSISNSILLELDEAGDFQKLKWNSYDGWDSGVDHYEIQILINGQWETIQILPPTVLELINP